MTTQKKNSSLPKKRLSLKARILLSGMLINLIILPFVGLTLNQAFEEQLNTSLNEQLQAHVFSVLSVLEVLPSSSATPDTIPSQIFMPDALVDNQFNLIGSGLYAFITHSLPAEHMPTQSAMNLADHQTLIWQSASALSLNFEKVLNTYAASLSPKTGQTESIEIDIDDTQYLTYSYGVSVERPIDIDVLGDTQTNTPDDSAPQTQPAATNFITENEKRPTIQLVISILKNKDAYRQQLSAFTDTLWTWLIVLMLVLFAVQLLWLYWILKPLRRFSTELHDLEQGERESLSSDYPKELDRVSKGLNSVVKAYDSQQQKYRNALTDLAHSLKTPLAIIQSQKDLSEESIAQSQAINRLINYQLNKTKVSTKPLWSSKTDINKLAQSLLRTFTKLYHDKNLNIELQAATHLTFNGDEGDLSEILGNIIDNACKAAKSQVFIHAHREHGHLSIQIEDDGSGLDDEVAEAIFERGTRADTYADGHGIGLAIVQDLVATYKGQLTVGRSNRLQGACFTLTFS